MNKNYVVKCKALTPVEGLMEGEAPKMATIYLVLSAVSYTDAESSAYLFYEEHLVPRKYGVFSVEDIKGENHQHVIDALYLNTMDEDDREELGILAQVYRVKVETNYRSEPNKWTKINILVRAYDIETATTAAVDYIAEEWSSDVTKCSNVSETNLSPLSPIFNSGNEAKGEVVNGDVDPIKVDDN